MCFKAKQNNILHEVEEYDRISVLLEQRTNNHNILQSISHEQI